MKLFKLRRGVFIPRFSLDVGHSSIYTTLFMSALLTIVSKNAQNKVELPVSAFSAAARWEVEPKLHVWTF
jgi:hypothetical protein